MTLWSLTRIVWGIATLLVFVYKIELLQDSNTPVWSFVVLLLLFFVCEILPIIGLLDYSYLPLVGLERIVQYRSEDDDGEVGSLLSGASINVTSPARSVRWTDEALMTPSTEPLLPQTQEEEPGLVTSSDSDEPEDSASHDAASQEG